jgi:Hypothetical protein (DUF2513)
MKRDMDFVREILLQIESRPDLDGIHWIELDESDFPGHTNEEIAYHIQLLVEAGLVEGTSPTYESPSVPISRLTWPGHEFLDNIKDKGVWESVKKRIDKLPGVALAVVVEIAKEEIKRLLMLK